MGNDCFHRTVNEVYSKQQIKCIEKQLSSLNVNELKQKWTAIQIFKIKRVFDNHSKFILHLQKEIIDYDNFKQIFSEFVKYEQKQIQRIYQIFDQQNIGLIDWNNFLKTISICYHANTQILSVIMFMIFDECLARQLTSQQVRNLIDLNLNCLKGSQFQYNSYYCQYQLVQDQLLPQGKQYITIQEWIKQSGTYFDFNKFRQLFNIFTEQKLEKELIKNFQSWNQLYNQKQNKYISYLVDFKWFELWKSYVLHHYGFKIILAANKNPNTLKSFKTKKTLKTINSIKSQKKKTFHQINIIKNNSNNSPQHQKNQSTVNNYNLIHSHIGSKPRKIFNNNLEGQFQEVLTTQLVQSIHYILLSEQVWSKLKYIYDGYPEFRRTGINTIQLYPKRVILYSQLFNQKIDYSSQVIRQVPCHTKIQSLLIDSILITAQQLKKKIVFFKTIGMIKWQQLSELTYLFSEITSQIVIFMVYLDVKQSINFRKNHCKTIQTIHDINLGDEIKFDHPNKNQIKKAFYMGQDSIGRHLIHFKGHSYIHDQLVQTEEFIKKASLINRNYLQVQQTKFFSLQIPFIPIIKSFSFLNALIIFAFSNPNLRTIISQYSQANDVEMIEFENKKILDYLVLIQKQIKKKSRVELEIIEELMQNHLGQFVNFELSMIQRCFESFMGLIDQHLRLSGMKNIIKQQYQFSMLQKVKCCNCDTKDMNNLKTYSLSIDIPQSSQKFYEFTYVPFSYTLKSLDLKKYGFKLKCNATYKQYKNQVTKLLDQPQNHFVICQVYGNDIIRNFSQVKDDITLDDLSLRETDNIYVYELFDNFQQFIVDHYTHLKDISQKKFREGQYIDCHNSNNDKWMIGKIKKIQFMHYTQKTIIKVQHKQNYKTKYDRTYQLNNQNISIFPTKSYLYGQQYHLKTVQRCYNEALNEMILCNIPLVMVLTNWMRCKQFQFVIYQQMKNFITENYRFKNLEFQQLDDKQFHKIQYTSQKQQKKIKIQKFKQYLTSQTFPYSISILDLSGRCLICHKINKHKIDKGESDYYCIGCPLNFQDPIVWQIPIHNAMVCIDWLGYDRFKKNIIKDHKSFTDMIMKKKNDLEKLQKLIQFKFSKRVQIWQQLCCNFPYETKILEKIKLYPKILVIQIQRIVSNGSYKKFNQKHLSFPFIDLTIQNVSYDLSGIISFEGNNHIQYKNYISNQNDEWFEIHGQVIKKVKKNIVQKCCALFLIYKINQKQSKNKQRFQLCEQSDEYLESSQDCRYSDNQFYRNKKKNLTIKQRLEDFSSDQSMNQLNTQNYDEIQLDNQSDHQNNSQSHLPQRSSDKKCAQYVKDSSSLIKSVSQCSRSNQKKNVYKKKTNKSVNSIKNGRIQNSALNFQTNTQKIQKITFKFHHKTSNNVNNQSAQNKNNDDWQFDQDNETKNYFFNETTNKIQDKVTSNHKQQQNNEDGYYIYKKQEIKKHENYSKTSENIKFSEVYQIEYDDVEQKKSQFEIVSLQQSSFEQKSNQRIINE